MGETRVEPMMELFRLGLTDVAAPLFVWIPLFALGALGLGVLVHRRCRAHLHPAGRWSRGARYGLVLVQLLLLPLGAGLSGAGFSLQRSIGALIEGGGERMLVEVAALGARSAKQALGVHDDDSEVEVARVRSALASSQAAGLGPLPAARIGGPIALLIAVPVVLQAAYWASLQVAARTFPDGGRLTWRELHHRATLPLLVPGNRILAHFAERFYGAARQILYLILIALALIHGGALLLARRLARPPESARI